MTAPDTSTTRAGGYATVEMADAMLNYPANDISRSATSWTYPNLNVTAEQSGEVSADPRELSRFRVYVDPDFRNTGYDEAADRATDHSFPFGFDPPSDTETNGTTIYSLTTTRRRSISPTSGTAPTGRNHAPACTVS